MSEGTISRKGKWNFTVSKELVVNTKLSKDARFLWIVLASYCSPGSPQPFPSIAALRRIMGISRDTLAKYGRELIDAGYMAKEQRFMEGGVFGSNSYTLLEPDESPLPSFPAPVQPATVLPAPVNQATKSTHTKEVPVQRSTSTDTCDPDASKKTKKIRCTQEELLEICRRVGTGNPELDADGLFNKWEGNGWKNGGKTIKNVEATVRSWKAFRYLPSQKAGTGGGASGGSAISDRIALEGGIRSLKERLSAMEDATRYDHDKTPERMAAVREVRRRLSDAENKLAKLIGI